MANIDTTFLDAGTDKIKPARVALLETVQRVNLLSSGIATRPARAAFIEQHLSGFFGRGMLTAEVINTATEQALVGTFSAGASTLVMSSATQIVVGGCVTVKHDNGMYGTYFVDSKATNNIGIRPALRHDCLTGNARIERTWYNRAHPGKFYMRELAQRIARSTELECAMPQGNRVLFTNVDSNPNLPEDTLVSVGGAAINYYPASNLGESGLVADPVRFALGRTAYVDTFVGAGKGVETQLFDVTGVANALVKVSFLAQGTATSFAIQVVSETGRVLGKYVIPAGANHRVMRIYTLPCELRSARQIKVQILCEVYSVAAYFTVDQIDVFEAPQTAGRIFSNIGAKIVCLGDSWTAGDAGDAQRESITTQLAQELPYATIINAGVGGNTISNMLARFDADVTPHNPDYVVIETGTNESYNPLSATFDPNAINAFVDAYKTMLNKVASIGARPIIVGVPALAQSDADVPAFAEWLLNDRAKAYAKAIFDDMGRNPSAPLGAGQVIAPDGTAIKFADGTMICRHTITLATTAALTLALTTWNYPVSFVGVPKVSTTISNYATAQLLSCGGDTPSASAVVIKLVSGTTAFTASIDCIAVGRWRT